MATPDFKKRVIDLLSGTFAANGYYGFPDLGTNSALVASILTSPSYSDGERTKLYNWFAGSPVRVLNEYPRDTAELPAVFVWRLSDAESSGRNILGDYLGVDDDLDTDETGAEIKGTIVIEQIQVQLWTAGAGGAGQRDVLFLVLRELLLRGRGFFDAAGIARVVWSNGKDGQLYDPNEEPHIVHTATGMLTAELSVSWGFTAAKTSDIQSSQYIDADTGEVGADEWEDGY